MFAGSKRRSSNVRVMQIFHELKAQFPTIPDHIITSCITSHFTSKSTENIYHLLLAAAAREQNQMGRPSIQLQTPPFIPTPAIAQQNPTQLKGTCSPISEGSRDDSERIRIGDMNDSESDINKNVVNKSDECIENINRNVTPSDIKSDNKVPKRPNTLDIKVDKNVVFEKDRRLQLSEKCRDVHKLLNSPLIVEKPPRSPLSAKRFMTKHPGKKDSPTSSSQTPKKETASTPTQTTDTLVNNIVSPSVNLSLNVNCQMGLVQSPTKPKCSTKIELTPTQPWLNPNPFLNDATSPRSFTSVSLTLRPPSSTPQDPIDITSQNSSLTYSTSSFDRQKGLQSRLQITVGPGNAGSVSSVRARPRSFHIEESPAETSLVRTGSLNNLATGTSEYRNIPRQTTELGIEKVTETEQLENVSNENDDYEAEQSPRAPVLLKQQARIDRMQIELQTGNARLVIMRQEVADLEKRNRQIVERRATAEIEKQFRKEIKHLTYECEKLADLLDTDEFYNNIYTGPTGPLLAPPQQPRPTPRPQVMRRQSRGRLFYQAPPFELPETEGPKWNCSLCTFLNHPDLDKCEQCEMPRVLHGRGNANLTLDALQNIPNPADWPVSFDMFKKSADALRNSYFQQTAQSLPPLRTSSSLSPSEMLRRLQLDNSNNNNINSQSNNPDTRFPISNSVSAPNVITMSMQTNTSDV